LTYSAANLPSGASFNAPAGPSRGDLAATRRFICRVHFQVSDGRLTDQEDIAVTVKAVQNDDNRKTSGSGGGGVAVAAVITHYVGYPDEGLASTPAVQISPDGMVMAIMSSRPTMAP